MLYADRTTHHQIKTAIGVIANHLTSQRSTTCLNKNNVVATDNHRSLKHERGDHHHQQRGGDKQPPREMLLNRLVQQTMRCCSSTPPSSKETAKTLQRKTAASALNGRQPNSCLRLYTVEMGRQRNGSRAQIAISKTTNHHRPRNGRHVKETG